RHKFRYTIGSELYGRESGRLITFERTLPELAGKQLALSFRPSTSADEDLIDSYLPQPDPISGEVNPEAIPDTLPGYLINLTAELVQDGVVISSADAGTMGGALYETLALWSPAQGWLQAENHPIAGEYRAIALALQGPNPEETERLKQKLDVTKNKLVSGDEAQIQTITRHDLAGDLLYATIRSYFDLNDNQDEVQSRAAGVVSYRLPSFGMFTTSLQTNYWYGIPRNVSFAGLTMDVDHLAVQAAEKNNDKQRLVDFMRAIGIRASAMEHLVPELMYSTPETPVHGMSAVKAIAVASTEGQRVWTIDRTNLSTALAAINLGTEIETEIRNAVNAGKIAVAHEAPIAFAESTAIGYMLIDPVSGAGAYKIAEGFNGGLVKSLKNTVMKLTFWTGVFQSLNKSNIVVKAIVKSLGQVVTVFTNAYKFLTECSSVSLALALTLVFTLISVAIAIALFFVAGPMALVLSIGIGVIESKLADYVVSKGC